MVLKELSFYNHEKGMEVAKALLDEHYVVMLSYEEDLLIINVEYSNSANRNDVVFMSKEEFEEKYIAIECLEEDDEFL